MKCKVAKDGNGQDLNCTLVQYLSEYTFVYFPPLFSSYIILKRNCLPVYTYVLMKTTYLQTWGDYNFSK